MRLTLIHNKQLISFLTSYLIILVFFVTVCSCVYSYALHFIEEVVLNAHQSAISQLSQSVDAKILEMEWISSEITLDKDVLSQRSPESASPTVLTKITERLKKHLVARQYIKDIFVIYPKRDLAISANGTCNIAEYCELYYTNTLNDRVVLAQAFSERNLNAVTVINRTQGETYTNDLLFLRSIEYEPNIDQYSNVGILLSNQFFNGVYDNLKAGQLGTIVIFNDQMEPIYSSNTIAHEEINALGAFAAEKGIFEKQLNGLANKVVYVTGQKGLKYAAMIPVKSFAAKLDPIKNIMFLSIFIYILFGIAASIIFTLKNYRPIIGIIRTFEHLAKISADNPSDEYTTIETIISNIVQENKMIAHLYNKQKNTLRNFFLLNLIKGHTFGSASHDDFFASYDIHFPYDGFLVTMLYLEDSEDCATEEEQMNADLKKFVLENIFSEYLDNLSIKNCCFEADGAVFAIINISPETRIAERLKSILEDIHKIIYEHFQINFYGLVSSTHTIHSGIGQCYNECMEAAEYRLVLGGARIVFYNDLTNNSNPKLEAIYPFEQQQKFMNQIKAGDFISARGLIDAVFAKFHENSTISLDVAKCSMFAIINTLVNVYEDTIFLEDYDIMRRLVRCQSLVRLNEEMTRLLSHIESNFNEKQKKRNLDKILDINKYIQNNLNDHTLSLASIAGFFDMNPSYLSHYYKEQTGEGLLYTINKLRVENTKLLLIDQQLTLKEIARLTGFVNDTVLIRTFKKYEGVTPGQYRKI